MASIDPNQPLFDPRPMIDRVQDTWGAQRLLSFLFSIFAGLALVLATIGLYGLLAYTTLKRVREIGIRLALGARPAQIRALILSHGLQLLLIGSAIGLVAAFAFHAHYKACFSKSKASIQEFISASARYFSPQHFLASWIPAHRASRVNPVVAFRAE